MKHNNEESWIPFPRKDLTDLREGKITHSEYILYSRLRHSANPYGITTVNTEGLVSDFHDQYWSANNITKLLLALKRKRYIDYPKRAGRRGSFDIKFGNFFLPSGAISKIEIVENSGLVRGEDKPEIPPLAEVAQSVLPTRQRSSEGLASIRELVQKFSTEDGRGSNNDTETKKEKETNRSRIFEESIREIPVRGYIPTSYEEQLCLEIAQEVEEQSMNFLLGTHHRYGIAVIESAWSEYNKLSENKKREIEDKAKYFNGIVSQILIMQGKK